MIGKRKSPQDRIRKADNSTQNLRDKRSTLDPDKDSKKIKRINNKIHKNNVETEIANRELSQPKTEIKNTTNNFSINKNDKSKSVHLHYHNHKDKSKRK